MKHTSLYRAETTSQQKREISQGQTWARTIHSCACPCLHSWLFSGDHSGSAGGVASAIEVLKFSILKRTYCPINPVRFFYDIIQLPKNNLPWCNKPSC